MLGVPNIAAAGVAIHPDLTGFGRELQTKMPGLLGAAGGIAGTAFIASLGTALGAANVFAGFETNMSRITGLVGLATDEVARMGEELKEIAPAVGVGPEELADALYFVVSAGIDAADAVEVVETSARAAQAGLGDLATIADAVTSAMNAYGPEVLSAEEATDILVATVREGKAEAAELGGAIGRVIPIASEAGVSFNEVGAAVASMTLTGLDANEAVTALRGVFGTLVSPTKEARDVLESVGLTTEGLRQTLDEEGLLAVLQILNDRFGTNLDLLSTIVPNIRALTGFLSLMGDNAGTVEGIFAEMNDVAGATDAAFGAVAETTEFKLSQAMATLKTALTEAGVEAAPAMIAAVENLLPVLTDLIPLLANTGTSFLNFFASLQPGIVVAQDVLLGIEGFGAAFGSLFTGDLSFDSSDLISEIAGLRDTIQSGADPAVALANHIVHLGQISEVTSDGVRRLQQEAGLSNTEMQAVAATFFDAVAAGREVGFTYADLVNIFGGIPGALDVVTSAAAGADQKFLNMAASGSGAAGAIGGVAGAAADLETADAVEELSAIDQAFLDAVESGESLRTVIQEIADPVFAAISSFQEYKDTLDEVKEDGKVTGEEQLRLAEAALQVGADFGTANTDLQAALQAIAAASGQTVGDVIADLESIGIEVDGGEITAPIVSGMLTALDGLGASFAARTNEELAIARNIIEDTQGIKSPSTVWRDNVGAPIGAGIAEGIALSAGQIESALVDAVPLPAAPAGTQVNRSTAIQIFNPSTRDLLRDTDRAVGVAATHDLMADLVGA